MAAMGSPATASPSLALETTRQLTRNPSLKSRLSEAIEDGCALGRLRAARQMRVEPETLPDAGPYDRDTVMHRVLDETRT